MATFIYDGFSDIRGFALLVQGEDGERYIVYSNNIAKVRMNAEIPLDSKVCLSFIIDANSFDIQTETGPLDLILKARPLQIEAKDE